MVLRAELSRDHRQIVAHTTALGADSVCVRTDEPLELGDSVGLELSFRRLLSPLRLHATVLAKRPESGPGYPAAVTLGFTASPEQASVIATLLAAPTRQSPAQYRFLVVEDSEIMRQIVQAGADRFSAAAAVQLVVQTAESAEAALALLEGTQFDLALVDFYLGGELTGADLVRRIRERDPEITLIGFSIGKSTARGELLAAGADLFLDKPVTVKDLFTTVERLMALHDSYNPEDRQ
ncbi:MAG TPA: response regulator [Kofleriaceae bacterium]|nr:response regulator [Kofleriaceae bacterium]